MDKLFDTPVKKIIFGIIIAVIFIWLVHLIFFNKTETETETKPIKPVKPVRPLESRRISIINNPEDIKNGKYREVPNSDFFGSNPNIFQFVMSIKFNLEKFNNTLQSIIGNVQNNSANNWGLWVTPQRKLQWRVNNLSWDLNNFGELKNNTLYEIVITYDDDNKYMFSLNVLSSIKQEEYFNVIEPKPIMIDAPPLNKNSGVVTFGGDYPQSNTNSKFLGSINQIITREVVFISPTT
jgi:hypothetical protein